ncbi:hypothetical protein CCACVL1_25045 [Corchorus capsularis]|uniref:Uncharacterized protein n=1 Tax=Corchorus capsularis TaxID=210143 RepID=A0A1R3GM19_COCAP|nr:hypothetical protein CCACVL1_25045 [Corchorus capsularis]
MGHGDGLGKIMFKTRPDCSPLDTTTSSARVAIARGRATSRTSTGQSGLAIGELVGLQLDDDNNTFPTITQSFEIIKACWRLRNYY